MIFSFIQNSLLSKRKWLLSLKWNFGSCFQTKYFSYLQFIWLWNSNSDEMWAFFHNYFQYFLKRNKMNWQKPIFSIYLNQKIFSTFIINFLNCDYITDLEWTMLVITDFCLTVSEEAVREYEALQQKYELEKQCRSGAEQFATEVYTCTFIITIHTLTMASRWLLIICYDFHS